MEIVYKQVQEVLVNEHVFWEVQKVIENNDRLQQAPGFFNEWMASVFVHSAAVAARLQTMTGQNSVSLRRILEELQQHPEIVSREYFVGLHGDEDGIKEMGHRTFDRLAGPGAERLDSKRIDQDLKQLDRMADQIKHYTNRRIAHYDERGLRQDLPTFDDLTKCLKGLDELVKKYRLVLEAVSMSSLLPTFQFDWKEVFYFPWIEQNAAEE